MYVSCFLLFCFDWCLWAALVTTQLTKQITLLWWLSCFHFYYYMNGFLRVVVIIFFYLVIYVR